MASAKRASLNSSCAAERRACRGKCGLRSAGVPIEINYASTRLSVEEMCASLIPGLLIMALAVAKAIPDFHHDRLAGLGVAGAAGLEGIFPRAYLAALVALPLAMASARQARISYETPWQFVAAILCIVNCYLVAVSPSALRVLFHGWR